MSLMTAPMLLQLACDLALRKPREARWCALQAKTLATTNPRVRAQADALLGAL
jgi:hypothetical protein